MKFAHIRWLNLLLVVGLLLPWSLSAAPVSAAVKGALPTGKNAQSTTVPRYERADCPQKIQERIPSGDNAECGVLVVPASYADPGGASIQLDVVIIPAVTLNKANDPVVFAQGGPGGSTIDYFTQVLFNSSLRANRDFVLFDQRGTMYSQPSLYCQEIFDETVRTLDQNLSTDESNRLFDQAAMACHDRMVKEGIDLSNFNSVENARDIGSLAQAMGYSQINLYGVSYGTLLALHAMREVPDVLRSVIIDSVVPTTIDFNFDAPNSENRAFTELFKACQQDARCMTAYPNLESNFFNLVDRLNQKPATITLSDRDTGKSYPALIDGDALVGAVFQMLYATELIPYLPKMIDDAGHGRFGLLETIYSLITFDRTMNYGMYFSVVCAEDGIVDVNQYSYAGVRPEISKDAQAGNESLVSLCKSWNVNQLGASADAPVVSDIPTLIFNGRFDPITPPAYGKEAAKTLKNSYYFLFPNTGHGALNSEACANDIFLEFLSKPSQAPDGSCIDKIPPVKFLTKKDVVDLALIPDLNALKPSIYWQGGVFGLGLLGLLSAVVVFPLAWVIRRLSSRPGRETPGLVQLAPWLPFMNAGALLALGGGLIAVLGISVSQNNTSALAFGIPARFAALLILGFLSLGLSLLMIVFSVTGWFGRYWSVGRKIYYTFLGLCALAIMVVMAQWGFFSFFL